MNATFSEAPSLFGMAHIVALIVIALFNVAVYFLVRNRREEQLISILNILGLFMILSEVFKQWFCYKYVFNGEINLWFFPWQLCSMAMYCSFAVKYLKRGLQNAVLVFIATYLMIGAFMALLLPYDMLRIQIPLFLHTFAYHGLMITEVILAILVLSKRWQNRDNKTGIPRFMPAVGLFLFFAVIAEVVNVAAHIFINDAKREPNMFYINPAYPTTQPIFHDIAVNYGIPVEIAVYLGIITLVAFLIFLILRRRNKQGR